MFVVFALLCSDTLGAKVGRKGPLSVKTTELTSGVRMPMQGLGCASGVWKTAMNSAIQLGYRFFDTAAAYDWGYREHEVGEAWSEVTDGPLDITLDRKDVWLQTKLHPRDLGVNPTRAAFEESLRNLKTDHIDSYLIHFPWCHTCEEPPVGTWKDSWGVLEELYKADKITGGIGVCNFNLRELEELYRFSRVKPHILQNWMDPYHQDSLVREYCKNHGIQYQAYSSLGTQWRHTHEFDGHALFDDPVLKRIAVKHEASVAQIILRWQLDLDVAVIPAARGPKHQAQNIQLQFLKLDEQDMADIAALDGKEPGKRKTRDYVETVTVNFENSSQQNVKVYWKNPSSHNKLIGELETGEVVTIQSHRHHRFVASVEGQAIGNYDVTKGPNEEQTFIIKDRSKADL